MSTELELVALEQRLRQVIGENLEPDSQIIRNFVKTNALIEVGLPKLLKSLPYFIEESENKVQTLIDNLSSSFYAGEYANEPELLDKNQFTRFEGVRYFAAVTPYQINALTYPNPADDPNLYVGSYTDLFEVLTNVFGCFGLNYVGMHQANVVYQAVDSVTIFGGIPYRAKLTATLPYTSTEADPSNDTNLEAFELSEVGNSQTQSEVFGTNVFPESGVLQVGMTIPASTTKLRVASGASTSIVGLYPQASGEVTAVTTSGATIGGVSVIFTKPDSGVVSEDATDNATLATVDKSTILLAYTTPTNVTALEAGTPFQRVTIIAQNGNATLVNGTGLSLESSTNVTLTPNSVISFVYVPGNGWVETSRSLK